MDQSFRAVVLGVKHMNHFVLKEYDTLEAQRYLKLEKALQISYGNRNRKAEKFKVGSYVSAHVSFGSEKGPKLWLRGVIRENYHQKDFLYGVHFGDYGFDKTCHKSLLRDLLSYHYPEYVPFQEFNFYLTDVDHKPDVNKEDVLDEVRNQFEAKNFVVLVTVEGKDRKGSIYGSIQIEENCDLAALLLEKQLVIDTHYCGRYHPKKSFTQSDAEANKESVGPQLPGPFRSGIKASRVGSHPYELICKCDAVVKYKRKLLSEKLKLTSKMQNMDSEKSSNSEVFHNTL